MKLPPVFRQNKPRNISLLKAIYQHSTDIVEVQMIILQVLQISLQPQSKLSGIRD